MDEPTESQLRIPEKQYFRIGEVSRILDIPAYVLRFWETEFPRIKPRRTPSGQRLYHRDNLSHIFKIKTLLYDHKFTIKGARQHLKINKNNKQKNDSELIQTLREELQSIRDMLT